MYDEFVKRLRNAAQWSDKGLVITPSVCLEAADVIEEIATNFDTATDIMEHQTEYIEELKREIDSANEAATALYGTLPKWIPVTERLPENGAEVLACNEDYGYTELGFAIVAVWDGTNWIETWDRNTALTHITHWMPIPEPPKENEYDS